MKNLIYRALKISIGVTLAIFIAQIVGLTYSTTAGIIAMLSILDTRKQTYTVGIKRMGTSLMAIVIATVLFQFYGHNLIIFALFLVIYVPLLTVLKSTEGLTVSTVLVTHIYTLGTLGLPVMMNEMGLMVIGVLVAWSMNLHMPNVEQEIRQLQVESEKLMKLILHKMKLQLLNQCSIEEQEGILAQLNIVLKKGLEKSFTYSSNYFLKDNSYFIRYFQMRRQQYYMLVHMEKYFEHIFTTLHEAKLLSEFTESLADEFKECNNGEEALRRIDDLKAYYKQSDLPKTREEFENRATLYQYLNDLTYFVEIKNRFITAFGEIVYCSTGQKNHKA